MKQLMYDLLVGCTSSIQLIEIVVFCWIGLCVNNQYEIGRKGKRSTIYLSWCCRCVVQILFHFLEHHTKTHQRRRRLPYCDVGSWSSCIKVGLCGVEKREMQHHQIFCSRFDDHCCCGRSRFMPTMCNQPY